MSVSPRQNFLKPPPVPEMPTVTLIAPFFAFWNSSATASVIGNTVLEPSILTTWAEATGAIATPPMRAATAAYSFQLLHEESPLLDAAPRTGAPSAHRRDAREFRCGVLQPGLQRPPGRGSRGSRGTLDDACQLRRNALDQPAVLALDHDAQHRLGAGRAQQQPPGLAETALGGRTCLSDRRVSLPVEAPRRPAR